MRKRILIISLCCVAAVLCAGFSFFGTLAKVTTTQNVNDSARSAVFSTVISGDSETQISLDIDNITDTYEITVMNYEGDTITETALAYSIYIDPPEALPTGISVTVDGVAPEISGKQYIFSNDWTMPAGIKSSRTHTITFSLDITKAEFETIDLNGIEIYARAYQKNN